MALLTVTTEAFGHSPNGPLLQNAVAVQELLGSTKRRFVQLPRRRDQAKVRSELGVQRLCVVPDHLEPAAPRRPLWSESAYDDMTAAFHRAKYLTDICPSIGCGGKEVKNRAIMPHVVGTGFQFCPRNVGDQPANTIRSIREPLPAEIDGRLRNIKNGQVGVTASEQVVDERGLTGADIDDRSRWPGTCLPDQLE
jgi:hypothetical protein